jgi:hypothetical protein
MGYSSYGDCHLLWVMTVFDEQVCRECAMISIQICLWKGEVSIALLAYVTYSYITQSVYSNRLRMEFFSGNRQNRVHRRFYV